MLMMLIDAFLTFVPLLVGVAFVILFEIKLLGAIQRRVGPQRVGFLGILQALVDGFKLILKENTLPNKSSQLMFLGSAFFIFAFSLIGWSVVPTGCFFDLTDADASTFIPFFLSLLNAFFIVLAGWSSNSKYSFIWAIRSAAQVISYEVYFGILLIPIFFLTSSLSLSSVMEAQKDL